MANMTQTDRFAQRRGVSVGVYTLKEADILASGNAVVANLPANVLIISSRVIVTTKSSTASSSISIDVGSTAVHANASVAADAVVTSTTAVYAPTGGALKVKPGTTPPAAGDLVATVVIEYIELDKVNGEYTAITV